MIGRLALVCAALMITSCPDPEATYDEWLETTEDMRVSGDGGIGDGQHVDFAGDYLLSVEIVPLGVPTPLMFGVEVEVNDDLTLIDMILQPLKTDFPVGSGEPRPDARTPIGDSITVTEIPFEEDGTFVADVGGISIDGDANPITGSNIVAELTLHGTVLSASAFCGNVTGQVTVPLELDLTGTTFGAVQTDDPTTVEDPPVSCPGDDTGDADAD